MLDIVCGVVTQHVTEVGFYELLDVLYLSVEVEGTMVEILQLLDHAMTEEVV